MARFYVFIRIEAGDRWEAERIARVRFGDVHKVQSVPDWEEEQRERQARERERARRALFGGDP
jgi:hypothetical protein